MPNGRYQIDKVFVLGEESEVTEPKIELNGDLFVDGTIIPTPYRGGIIRGVGGRRVPVNEILNNPGEYVQPMDHDPEMKLS